MERLEISDATRREYDRIAQPMADGAGVKPGHMMGNPTLYIGGKAFVGLFGDAMIFKLAGEAHARALALPGASLFDPSGRGRPMKAWVQVPLAEAAAWPDLADHALDTQRAALER